MNDNINIAELLKDCHKGMELYSPLCGKCVFDHLNMGTIICKKQNTQEIAFTSNGYYMLPVFDNCECMIFPSKDQRDWSKFQRPFKDGDILSYQCGGFKNRSIYIYKYHKIMNTTYYVALSGDPNSKFMINDKEECALNGYNDTARFATEEEKQKLFQAIKDNGYRWNADTKTLEKEEKKDKFDITTLMPFDKVLVRDANDNPWMAAHFSHYQKDAELYYPYFASGSCFKQCIPYEGDEHLLGTTNDCDDYYKTWNDETDE